MRKTTFFTFLMIVLSAFSISAQTTQELSFAATSSQNQSRTSSGVINGTTTSNMAAPVIIDRIDDNSSALVSTKGNNGTGVYSADYFVLNEATTIGDLTFYGLASTPPLAPSVTGFNIFIYGNSTNQPASNPENPGTAVFELANISSSNYILTVDGQIADFRVSVTQANGGVPVTLPAGEYWISAFPSVIGAPTGAGRWNWYGSLSSAPTHEPLLIDPANLFNAGATSWMSISTLTGANFPSFAWKMTEFISCSGTPDSGTTSLSSSGGNGGSTYIVSVPDVSFSDGLTYQWESDRGIGWEARSTSSSSYSAHTTTALPNNGDIENWRLKTTCTISGQFSYSTTATFTTGIFYCNPTISTVEAISRVVFSDIDNSSSATGTIKHEDFTAIIGHVAPGETHSFSAEGNTGGGYTNYFTVWIDWNQNGTFEAGEMYPIGFITGSTGVDGKKATANITVPMGAALGQTRMRVIKNYGSSPTEPCGSYSYGQAEDYTIDVNVSGNCSVVDAGTIVNDEQEVCAFSEFTLTVAGGTSGEDGLIGEWEVNVGDPNDPNDWVGMEESATSVTFIWPGELDEAYFRYRLTCTHSSNTDYSNVAHVTRNQNIEECYCTPTYSTGCDWGDTIDLFAVTGENGTSLFDDVEDCNTESYNDRTGVYAPVDFAQNGTYIATGVTGDGSMLMTVWIDLNNDGYFHFDEIVGISESLGTNSAFDIEIPNDALLGQRRMRVRLNWNTAITDACAPSSYGETHDYLVNIVAPASSGFVYENGVWAPSDPSGVATATDDITVINGSTSLSGITGVKDLMVLPGATLNIEGVLNLAGDMTIDGDLVFVSSVSGNGELGEVAATSTITGDATVQRYMKAKRSYRMVSSAVTTSNSVHANWQEGAANNAHDPAPGFGTHITGSSTDRQNGFDGTATGNPSMFTVVGQQFVAVSNTDVNTLDAGTPYLLFVRGDRSTDLTNNLAAGETVLRAKGTLRTGTYSQPFPTVEAGEFGMFGNPYQSAVNVNSVFANSDNVNAAHYYVYDPSLGNHGSYVTVILPAGTNTASSNANQYLQPGQGAQFATAANGASSIVFNETDKAPGNFTTTTANDNHLWSENMLTVQLFTTENFNNGGPTHDSFGIIFGDGLDNGITNADAVKPMNFYENIARDHTGTYLSLERREMPQPGEVLQLFSNGYTYADYTLNMKIDGLEDTVLYLDDHFTGTSTLIEAQTVYTFGVDAGNDMSIATDRFSVRIEQRLGVDNHGLMSDVRLFPNPMSDNTFYIHAPQLNGKQVEVSITDLSGREIYNRTLDCADSKIAVSGNNNLSSGVYLVTLKHAGESQTLRIVRE